MRVDIGTIEAGLMAYIDEAIISQLPGWRKFAMASAAALAVKQAQDKAIQLLQNPAVKALGLVDEGGLIDTSALRSAMVAGMDKTGAFAVEIPLIGAVTFNRADVDNLLAKIER